MLCVCICVCVVCVHIYLCCVCCVCAYVFVLCVRICVCVVCVCVCCVLVCMCVCVLAKVVNRGHPWVLLQATGHTFHTGHNACLFKVAKTMQNGLSIDPRGTLVVYNAPASFTYWVPTCVWMIAGTIQMGKIKKIYTHPQLLCIHPYWASSLNFYWLNWIYILNLINFHFN